MNIIRKFVVSPATPSAMKAVVGGLELKGIIPIFDYAVEHSGENNYKEVMNRTSDVVKCYPNNFSALKISAFDMKRNDEDIVKDCNDIIQMCKNNNTQVTIDAEQVECQDKISSITDQIAQHHEVYKTYQMYRKDSLDLLNNDINLYNRIGLTLNAKLVRGAYYVQDKKSGKLCDTIEDTHYNYNNGLKMIIDEMKKNNNMKLIAATHNFESMELTKSLINEDNIDRIYFAHLLGFLDKTSVGLKDSGYNVMKYVPYGPITKTYPYLFRRLIENYELTRFI